MTAKKSDHDHDDDKKAQAKADAENKESEKASAEAKATAKVPAKTANPIVPTVGRIVLYTLPRGSHAGETRPAQVVRVNGEGEGQTCNLSVQLDGPNDRDIGDCSWVGSARYDQKGAFGTWRWMDYQLSTAK